MIQWPHGKRAAFSIIDDTDDAVMPDIAEVYRYVIEAGMRTTKTVWVHPVRDIALFRGDTITGNADYLEFVRNLIGLGFEIGLHNVGSGDFKRSEIVDGLDMFKQRLGHFPRLHVNHSYNKDNIYGGEKRFSFPFNHIVKFLHPSYTGFEGEIPESEYFWGDIHKDLIKYSRAYEVDSFNLLSLVDFPFADRKYSKYCNYFYPSVFCSNQDLFAHKVTERNVAQLVEEGGCSIVYTHLGYFTERGSVDPRFIGAMEMLKSHSHEIWFAPVGEILDHIASQNGISQIPRLRKLRIELSSLTTRLKYRYIRGLDDFHYKKSIGAQHRATKNTHD